MKRLVCLLTVAAAVAFSPTANAVITNAFWADDGDGVLVCTNTSWISGESRLTMAGISRIVGEDMNGHMLGTIQTDSELDPTLTLSGTVVNDTGSSWWGYKIQVVMSVPFSFVSPGPTVSNPPDNDWFVSAMVTPTYQLYGPYAGKYVGSFDYSMGTPIDIGGEMDWLYSIDFSGGLNFSFTQEMTPWFTEIPEPSILGLAGMGGLMLALRLRRNRLA